MRLLVGQKDLGYKTPSPKLGDYKICDWYIWVKLGFYTIKLCCGDIGSYFYFEC